MRVLPLRTLNSPLDREFLTLIVEKPMGMMRVRRGRDAYTESRCEINHQSSFHRSVLRRVFAAFDRDKPERSRGFFYFQSPLFAYRRLQGRCDNCRRASGW